MMMMMILIWFDLIIWGNTVIHSTSFNYLHLRQSSCFACLLPATQMVSSLKSSFPQLGLAEPVWEPPSLGCSNKSWYFPVGLLQLVFKMLMFHDISKCFHVFVVKMLMFQQDSLAALPTQPQRPGGDGRILTLWLQLSPTTVGMKSPVPRCPQMSPESTHGDPEVDEAYAARHPEIPEMIPSCESWWESKLWKSEKRGPRKTLADGNLDCFLIVFDGAAGIMVYIYIYMIFYDYLYIFYLFI